VILNDSFAYFSGRTFGRTKLISLSPNKTLEGFIGGAIANFIFTYYIVDWAFSNEDLICMIDKVPMAPFAPFYCSDTLSLAYTNYEQQLPFPIFGHTHFTTSRAKITA